VQVLAGRTSRHGVPYSRDKASAPLRRSPSPAWQHSWRTSSNGRARCQSRPALHSTSVLSVEFERGVTPGAGDALTIVDRAGATVRRLEGTQLNQEDVAHQSTAAEAAGAVAHRVNPPRPGARRAEPTSGQNLVPHKKDAAPHPNPRPNPATSADMRNNDTGGLHQGVRRSAPPGDAGRRRPPGAAGRRRVRARARGASSGEGCELG